ncbi:MAG TPA: MMPL family transporter [Candidatus Nanoarchaeia archaeon]|nr:MMPL family transporter [Candidatus Nanoarchaeia archaeon]
MLERYVRFVEKHAKLLLFLVFLVTLFFIFSLKDLSFDSGSERFVPPDVLEKHKEIMDAFNMSSRPFYVLVTGKNISVLSLEALKEEYTLSKALESEFGIKIINIAYLFDFLLRQEKNETLLQQESWVNVSQTFKSALDEVRSIKPLKQQFKEFSYQLLSNDLDKRELFSPAILRRTLSANKTLFIVLPEEVYDEKEMLQLSLNMRDFLSGKSFDYIDAKAFSDLYLIYESDSYMRNEAFYLGILMFLIIAFILFLYLRRISYVMIPLIIIGVSLVWTFGTAAFLGIELTFLGTLIAPVLIGAGVDYSVHFIRRYTEERKTKESTQAFSITLAHTGKATFMTAVITAISFGSNFFSTLPPLKDFGIITAVGILYAFILTIVLQQALMSLVERPKELVFAARENPWSKNILKFTLEHYKGILLVTVLISLVSGYYALQINSYFDFEASISQEIESRKTIKDIRDNFPFELQIGALVRNADDPFLFEKIYSFEEEMKKSPYVIQIDGSIKTDNIRRALKMVFGYNESLAEKFEFNLEGIPTTVNRTLVLDLYQDIYSSNTAINPLFNLSTSNLIHTVLQRTDSDNYSTVIVAKMVIPNTEALEKGVSNFTNSLDIAKIQVEDFFGWAYYAFTIDENIAESNQKSVFFSILTIFVVLLPVYRKVREIVYLMLPILITILWTIGALSILGIALNPANAMVAVMIIGLGLDYNIHIVERYKEERQKFSKLEALENTLSQSGSAIFFSALTTVAAFAVIAISRIPITREFGLILLIAITAGFLFSSIITPILLYRWDLE